MNNEFKDRMEYKSNDKEYENFNILREKKEKDALKYFTEILKQQEAQKETQKNNKNKRNFKNSFSKIKNKKYKGKIKDLIKVLIATAIIAGVIAGGTYAMKKHDEKVYNYAATATRVEKMTDEELGNYIENILKEEVSKATGADTEEVNISAYSSGTTFKVTEVTAGENEYKYVEDLRSPGAEGNLKSKGLRKVIDETKNAKGDRKKLIKALMQAQKFSEEKDLVVEGDKLKEVDSDKTYDDER